MVGIGEAARTGGVQVIEAHRLELATQAERFEERGRRCRSALHEDTLAARKAGERVRRGDGAVLPARIQGHGSYFARGPPGCQPTFRGRVALKTPGSPPRRT